MGRFRGLETSLYDRLHQTFTKFRVVSELRFARSVSNQRQSCQQMLVLRAKRDFVALGHIQPISLSLILARQWASLNYVQI